MSETIEGLEVYTHGSESLEQGAVIVQIYGVMDMDAADRLVDLARDGHDLNVSDAGASSATDVQYALWKELRYHLIEMKVDMRIDAATAPHIDDLYAQSQMWWGLLDAAEGVKMAPGESIGPTEASDWLRRLADGLASADYALPDHRVDDVREGPEPAVAQARIAQLIRAAVAALA